MRKINILIFALLWLLSGHVIVNGQVDAAFTNVPVVNGKVVFQQFVPNSEGATADQQYARLQQWGRSKSQGNPLLSGIRFDDKGRTMTISSGQELPISAGGNAAGNITMRFRVDASVTNAGFMLTVRYHHQSEQSGSNSIFPKTYAAEQMITDQAVNAMGEERDLRNNTRRATLAFLNNLYEELSSL